MFHDQTYHNLRMWNMEAGKVEKRKLFVLKRKVLLKNRTYLSTKWIMTNKNVPNN